MQMMINLKSNISGSVFFFFFVADCMYVCMYSCMYENMVLTSHFPVLHSHETLPGMCSAYTSAPDLTLSN